MFFIFLLFLFPSNASCGRDNVTTAVEITLTDRINSDPNMFAIKCPFKSGTIFACNYGKKYVCVCNIDKEMGDTDASCDHVIPKEEISGKKILRARTVHGNISDEEFEANFLFALNVYGGLNMDQVIIIRKRCVFSSEYLDVYFTALPWNDNNTTEAELEDFIRDKDGLLNQMSVRIQSIKLLEGTFDVPSVLQQESKLRKSDDIDRNVLGVFKNEYQYKKLTYLAEKGVIEKLCLAILCFFVGGLFIYCFKLIKEKRIRKTRKGESGFFEIMESNHKKYTNIEANIQDDGE